MRDFVLPRRDNFGIMAALRNSVVSKRKNIVVSSAKMSATTLASRILGLIRDQFQAYLLGTTWASDAFTVAFQIPNLLRRLFAEGSMTASFVPVFIEVERERDHEAARAFFASFFTLLFFSLCLVVLAGVLVAPYLVRLLYIAGDVSPEKYALTVQLTREMFPYILLISLASLFQGVLNIRNNFTVPAFTPVLLNIAVITSALTGSLVGSRSFVAVTHYFALGVLIGGVLQVLFQIPFFLNTGYRIRLRFRFGDPQIRRILKLFLPGVFGVGIYQVNVLVSFGFAAALGVGRQAAIMFASRINELALGVFAVSLATVMLPSLSREAAENNRDEFVSQLAYSLRLLALVTVPAAVGLFVLSPDIVSLLLKFGRFGDRSVLLVSETLKYYSLALFFIASYRVVAQSFYSLKDTRTPVVVASFTLLLNAALCYLLPSHFPREINIIGIALANTISNSTMFFALFLLLKRKLGGRRIVQKGVSFVQTTTAALVMGVVAYAGKALLLVDQTKLQLLWRLPALILLCAAVYLGVNFLIGNTDMQALARVLRRRRAS